MFNTDGTLKKISELDRNTAACITRMQVKDMYRWDRKAKKKIKVGRMVRIKFADKGKNLKRLGRHLEVIQV